MRRALDRYASGMVPYSLDQYSPRMGQYFRAQDAKPEDSLNQAAGDFNGDGIRDLALYGHDETRELIVVLLSQADGTYKAIALREWRLSPDNRFGKAFLGVAPPGPLEEAGGLADVDSIPPPTTLAHEAIDIGYDGGGELFYWDGTRFVSVTTGD